MDYIGTEIARHPRAAARLRPLIAEIGQRSGEFPVLLANHLPMVLEAMGRLGASPERLDDYAVHYNTAHAVPFPPPPGAPLTEATWRTASGVMPRNSPSQLISRSCMPVRTNPGQTALTRMPLGANSRANPWVQPSTANLLAE